MIQSSTVGRRFSRLIEHLGITKNAFAASLGKTATVIQHLVDERNKPGFDLLLLVFEKYPNVSKDWLLQGIGPMLTSSPASAAVVEAATLTPPAKVQPPTSTVAEPAAAVSAPAIASASAAPAAAVAPTTEAATSDVTAKAAAAPETSDPASTPTTTASSASAVPPFATPDASWSTALYTQQMAHQLALAELRNQHLLDQQRLMQQMLDLVQRQLTR